MNVKGQLSWTKNILKEILMIKSHSEKAIISFYYTSDIPSKILACNDVPLLTNLSYKFQIFGRNSLAKTNFLVTDVD